jgi:hypothetical protein
MEKTGIVEESIGNGLKSNEVERKLTGMRQELTGTKGKVVGIGRKWSESDWNIEQSTGKGQMHSRGLRSLFQSFEEHKLLEYGK